MYYFIGIKGSGMSALAIILKNLGYNVIGSDVENHFFTEEGLVENDIKFLTYDENNIKEDYVIVKGASIKEDNVELIKARELGLKIYEYNELVGEISKKFKTICIAGCHGKTTTTSMMSLVLEKLCGANYLIGDGRGYANPNNELFLLESCEYQRHFLAYHPYYTVITNIDLDHVDYFKDISDVISAYQELADKTKDYVICYGDDNNVRKLSLQKSFYFGLNDNNNLKATNIEYKEDGISFDVLVENKQYGHYSLPIFGTHQLIDALAVISVCYLEKQNPKEVNEILSTFSGAKRRFTETKIDNNVVIDDYAHHPAEIKATLSAIKQKYPKKKIIAIFQPHTYSRTQEFYKEYINIFKKLDAVYILDIHPSREKQEDYNNITSDIIINELPNGFHINIDEAHILSKYDNAVFVFLSPNDLSELESELINLKRGL